MPIFSTYNKKYATGFDKIINRQPRENALYEISTLLTRYESNILQVPLEEIEAIARKHRIDLAKDFLTFRKDIFREYLRFCLKDYYLDWNEKEELRHLAGMLYLSNHDISNVLTSERKRLFKKKTRHAAKDGIITEREKAQLARLRHLLELDHGIAKRIKHEVYTQRYQAAVRSANADERVTDEEMKILEFIAGSMGLKRPHLDTATYRMFNRYRTYWLIENGRLPKYHPGIILNHGELAHFRGAIKWLERKLEKYTHEPRGYSHRIRYAHAYVFNHGQLEPAHIPEHEYEFVESGEVYITNQRLIFTGHSCNREVRLRDILNVFPYSNGVDVQRKDGRSPFLQFDEDVDLFSMTLNRVLMNVNH
ncbi:hypothetical protein FUA23_09405 [Neolewinella aurantiaca]|uniref:Uncharacterized protein n=1 Tax=Neolewinella aurantiaca TaxID=2602767 RepID=A0A5C7FXF2_9BACT|nr:hypothetical protein [Neolewinella aurantiaca]TXF89656.1 hypothetical protein FUA23_09405 [Neolewinella aurantiaca]